MPWHESSPRNWQRPLGENERMIKWIGDQAHGAGREQWSITTVGTFALSASHDYENLLTAVRKAWMLLRFQHPGIATTAGSDTLNYIVPDAAGLKSWADQTLHVIQDSTVTASDLIAGLQPSPFMEAYLLPHAQQIILHTAHWRTDGPGALQLLDAFFKALTSSQDPDTLPWGEESARLTLSIEEVLDLPVLPNPEIQAAAAACLATGAHIANSIGLPYIGDATTRPGGTRSIRRTIDGPATAAILRACAPRDLEPIAAVHAALASANFAGASSPSSSSSTSEKEKQPRQQGPQHYTSNMRFGLRRFLPKPYSQGPQHAAALYTGSYMAKVPAGQSWQETAAYYTTLYRAGPSREFLLARRQFAVQALEMMTRAAGGPGPPARSEIDMSGVDEGEELVAPGYGPVGPDGKSFLEVTDISLGVECLARESYLFFWMFRGQVELNLVYNEAFYDALFMKNILDLVEESLKSV